MSGQGNLGGQAAGERVQMESGGLSDIPGNLKESGLSGDKSSGRSKHGCRGKVKKESWEERKL